MVEVAVSAAASPSSKAQEVVVADPSMSEPDTVLLQVVDNNFLEYSNKDMGTDDGQRRPSRASLLAMSCRTPATSVSRAMVTDVTAVTSNLKSGISVQKVTSRGYIKPRYITISKDRLTVFCTHQPIKPDKSSSKGTTTDSSSYSSLGILSTAVASKLSVPIFSSKGIWGITQGYKSGFLRYMDVADIDYVCTGVIATRNLEQTRIGSTSSINLRDQIVTIVHHGDQTLDILVANDEERQSLIDTIRQMCMAYEKAAYYVSHDALLLRYIWYDVDINKDGRINESEFFNVLQRINFYVNNPSKAYREFCKSRSLKQGKGLILPEVVALLQTLKSTSGSSGTSMTDKIWNKCFGDKDTVDASEFLQKFIVKIQGETTKSIDDIKQLFKMINTMEIDHTEGEPDHIDITQQLSRPRFGVYVHHEMNDAYDPSKLKLLQSDDGTAMKLDKPISSYFINSSHNTYLTGDQLQSYSSVEMYGKALRRGCKCLELDCWDGDGKISKDGKNTGGGIENLQPVVFHGHTLTSKIYFVDILLVVKTYLIEFPDTYPIILSLETHCSTPFQTAMARMLVDTFGSKLYIPPATLPDILPSPESMRGMVVIKGKRPPDRDETNLDNNIDDDYDQFDTNISGDDGSPKAAAATSTPSGKNQGSDQNESVPVKPPKVCKELARLTLFHGTKWKSFEQSISEPKSHMHSIGESKITKIISKSNENGNLWRIYNEGHLTRTYPAGSRVDSSNYNPLLAWSFGCQLVALNFQTSDTPLILNDGFFRQNDNCGYILKSQQQLLSPPTKPTVQLKIRILSGSCLPKPRGAKTGEYIDPFVKICVHDITTSTSGVSSYVNYVHTTSAVSDNGFCPVWDEQCKDFNIYHPSIAMIQFVLEEADVALHEEVGYATIPINCVRTGYRSIQLYDRNNTRTGPYKFASILVYIQVIPL